MGETIPTRQEKSSVKVRPHPVPKIHRSAGPRDTCIRPHTPHYVQIEAIQIIVY